MVKRKIRRKRKRRTIIVVSFIAVVLTTYFFINLNNRRIDSTNNRIESIGKFRDKTNKSNSSQNLILVNKSNSLSRNYQPDDLVIPNIRFDNIADDMVQYVRYDAAIALEELFQSAESQGINLIAVSGYRSYSYQDNVYRNEVNTVGRIEADKYVAKAGESEHQTGLSMDILSDEYLSLDDGFENTIAFNWLENNMSKFGFILRFPKGKEDITGYSYEPWHIRYVGISAATEIMEEGLTLEEYLN